MGAILEEYLVMRIRMVMIKIRMVMITMRKGMVMIRMRITMVMMRKWMIMIRIRVFMISMRMIVMFLKMIPPMLTMPYSAHRGSSKQSVLTHLSGGGEVCKREHHHCFLIVVRDNFSVSKAVPYCCCHLPCYHVA